MADLERFREQVTIFRKRQVDPATGRPYTLEALAKAIGLSADELGHRLRGTGRSKLTPENVLAIVRTLAEWDTLTWNEAVALLVCMDYPLDPPDWQTDLRRLLGSLPSSVHLTIASHVASQGNQPSSPVPRRLFQARDLPKDYVPRPNVFNQIKPLLLTRQENQTTAITTALRGAGGFGKTTLALALCHDTEIQAAFPDGILWVELGEHPPGSLAVLNDWLHVLEPSAREAITLEEARGRWRTALEGKQYLLVIDDVWYTEALEELLQGGPRCGRLVTTRNDQLLPEAAQRVWVDAMEPEEAMALLCQGLGVDCHYTLERPVLGRVVVEQLGCWPLLVSLARGMLTVQMKRLNKTPQQALAQVKQAYEDRGMTAFHLGDRIERQRTANACVEVNLRQLEEWVPAHYQARQRYLELAVFPEDTDIPVTTLHMYWQGTGGLHAWEVEEFCMHLMDLSLLLPWESDQLTIRLHDVLRSYLIQRTGPHLPALHQRLLDACQQHEALTCWADLPARESYLWQHLVSHLCQAGNAQAIEATLVDLLYLTRKVQYVGVVSLEADLLGASAFFEQEGAEDACLLVSSLHRRMMRVHHLLQQVSSEAEIGGLLLSVLVEEEKLRSQRLALEQHLPRPFLTAWHPLPAVSSVALFRTLRGHTNWVTGCGYSPDGKWIVSASDDGTLKVWEAATGAERYTLHGHTDRVTACAFSPDGQWIVSASYDHTLKVWEAATGAERLTLHGHTSPVLGCTFSPDGKFIVSSGDGTLKVWEVASGACVLTFPVDGLLRGCVFAPDGEHLVACGELGIYFLRLVR